MQIDEVRIKLYVADFDLRKSFYQDVLQWPIIREWNNSVNDRGVMFQINNTIFELLEDATSKSQNSEVDLSLKVPDVWSLWKTLKDRVELEFSLRDNPWGDTSFCIVDPGGFRLTFFTLQKAAVE